MDHHTQRLSIPCFDLAQCFTCILQPTDQPLSTIVFCLSCSCFQTFKPTGLETAEKSEMYESRDTEISHDRKCSPKLLTVRPTLVRRQSLTSYIE